MPDNPEEPRFQIGDLVLVKLTGFDFYGLVTQIDNDADVEGDSGLVYILLDETLRVRDVRAAHMHDPEIVISLVDHKNQLLRELEKINTHIEALSAIANFLGTRVPDPRD
jgi:hypothetical protein